MHFCCRTMVLLVSTLCNTALEARGKTQKLKYVICKQSGASFGVFSPSLGVQWSPLHTSPSAHTWHLPEVLWAHDNTSINDSRANRNTRITQVKCSWHKPWASPHTACPNSPCSTARTFSRCTPGCRYCKTVQLSGKLEESRQSKSPNFVSKPLAETLNYFVLAFHLGLAEILLQNLVSARPKGILEACCRAWDRFVTG